MYVCFREGKGKVTIEEVILVDFFSGFGLKLKSTAHFNLLYFFTTNYCKMYSNYSIVS